MLTSKAGREFQVILLYGVNLRVSPIFWNSQEKRILDKVLYFIVFWVGIIYYSVDCCYLVISFHELARDPTTSLEFLAIIGLHTIPRAGGVLCQYYGIWKRKELENYCNQLLRSDQKLQGINPIFLNPHTFALKMLFWIPADYSISNADSSISVYSTAIERFIHLASIITRYYAFLPAVSVFLEPTSPKYWASRFLPISIYSSVPWKILYFLIEWHVTSSNVFIMTFLLIMLVLHINYLQFWLLTLRLVHKFGS